MPQVNTIKAARSGVILATVALLLTAVPGVLISMNLGDMLFDAMPGSIFLLLAIACSSVGLFLSIRTRNILGVTLCLVGISIPLSVLGVLIATGFN